MSESAMATSGPSLEQILWRALDRWEEPPSLVDAEEFADHIAGIFECDLPSHVWVERFFAGHTDRRAPPADMAEAIVQSTRQRLQVHQFDLRRLEYVIVEGKEQVVVVSQVGQFALQSDDRVRQAIEAAVVPESTRTRIDHRGSEPRAYLVRGSGEVVAVDVAKVARALEQFRIRQVSAPAVENAAKRLLPFAPLRRVALSEEREARSLRQDPRARLPLPPAPAANVASAQPAIFVVLPDGMLARAEIGAATRWREMISRFAARAAVPGHEGQRFAIQAGRVAAVVEGQRWQGTAGERALSRSQGISAVRAERAPIRVLGNDELAGALARGAALVGGLARGDRFWIHPEAVIRPEAPAQLRREPAALQLGEITGDPWADWALAMAGEIGTRSRSNNLFRAALDRSAGETPLRLAGSLTLAGARVVAFRAPDGTLVVPGGSEPIRLASSDRPDVAPQPIAARSGAIPASALAALQIALERTAAAGGYRLPLARLESAADALETGATLDLAADDPRRSMVRLAGSPRLARGQVAQLVLSMPFPNRGEVHVGEDLAEALQQYLGAAVVPSASGARWRRSDSSLPALLAQAVQETGSWTPGPGAPMPTAIRDVVGWPDEIAPAEAGRPLNAGEEEIVIPLPLWAQMGRGRISATDAILASPFAPEGFAPSLGAYRLVLPFGGQQIDLTGGARASVQLAGPTAVELVASPGGRVMAQSQGGRHQLGAVPVDDGRTDTAPLRLPSFPRFDLPSFGAQRPSRGDFAAGDSEAASGVAGLRGQPALVEGARQLSLGRDSDDATGLPKGAWSGATRSTAGYMSWTYLPSRSRSQRSVGGVDLSGLARPVYPSLPTGLRFRYAGAPLWWSGNTVSRQESARALRGGFGAASSAAALWSSIFAAGAGSEQQGSDDGLGARGEGLSGASLVSGATRGEEKRAFVAMARSGAAALASSVEMSIVAAIPPSPPPLASTSQALEPVHPRHAPQSQSQAAHGRRDQEDADSTSRSKIEGSVDAIAQRIYHRIRRRIENDRERFGG